MVAVEKIRESKNIEGVNKDFYNKLYKKRNPLIQLIYSFISYDQQSKSKYNYKKIKYVLDQYKHTDDFRFLDYGFGHGSLLLKIPKKKSLFGCDISFEAVDNFPHVAKLLGKEVKTFTPNQLLQQKIKFHMISMSHVLEHVEDDISLLKELFFLLEQGGYVLINVPVNEVWEDPKHVRKYTAESLKFLMESLGFKIISIDHKNRLSAFLLTNERVKKTNFIKKIFFRSFRFFMALMPLSFLESIDSIISNKYELQHLIVLARKND